MIIAVTTTSGVAHNKKPGVKKRNFSSHELWLNVDCDSPNPVSAIKLLYLSPEAEVEHKDR